MKEIVQRLPKDVIQLKSLRNFTTTVILCEIKFQGRQSYFYTVTRLKTNCWVLAHIGLAGGINTHNDSNDLKVWASPMEMLTEFLGDNTGQNFAYVFDSLKEMYTFMAEMK